ncbi:MAG TPA: sigma-70 family RNA polymerase sigma factor [Cellulomonas sp.]|uniref:sigma-70 family RNA polymerase sigma factor n=1 Tax=Cellulomonas sp. TaxID=40001 RepID=UPI002E309874|nr:sigma-70 family RNA polymerase sigma factor [Cellulomonas sp.]HEX5333499.1 sigma-70 family RNA polymerase sigma factor [Cellulomonas sp.]
MSSNAQVAGAILSDAELITAARAGDSSAFGQLYERHAGAAWAVARQYTNSQADAEDVVADAFTKVWTVVSGGGGPDVAFRAYLFTVIRRLGMLRVEGGRRVTPTDDAATFEAAFGDQESTENPALAGFERGVVARAFRTLPERWQAALWYTEVESLTPAEIAPLLGLTANGVAALAYRAREGLRQAYLQMHLQQPLDLGCRDVAGKLGAYVRGGLAARETAQVDEHLESCGRCRALVLELGDVSHGMRAVIAPLVLGVLGLGALTHPLPVGGGLAAGVAALGNGSAAAAAGAGAGTGTGASAGAGAGATGAGGAGAVSTGAVATVGPGAAVGAGAGAGAAAGTGALAAVGSVAATGGLAAFLGALPIGIVAAAAAVVVAGVAGIAGLLGVFSSGVPESGPPPEAAAMSTVSPEPTGTASSGLVPTATPTDGPTDSPTIAAAPGPTDVPTDAATPVPTAVPTGVAVAGTGSAVVPAPTSSPTVPAVVDPVPAPVTSGTPVATPPPAPTADPVVPGAPAFQLTTAPLTLAAQAAAQSVSLTVTNTGTADATDLTADVTLPAGAVVTGATTTLTSFVLAGRFEAAAPATDWTCTPGSDPQHATCRLALLASGATSRLTLTVLVGEDQDVSPADSSAISVVIRGLGIEPQTLTAPVTMKPSAARLRLDATPTVEPLVADNVPNAAPTSRGTLHLALSNAGQLAAATPTVTLQLPPRVHVAGASGSWTCTPSWPGGFDVSAEPAGGESVTCTRPQLGGRAADALDLELYAMVGAIQTASPEVSLGLSPDAPQVSQGIRVGLDIRTPAELRVTVPASSAAIDLVAGAPARIPVTVTNVGQTHATDSRVLLTLPAGARWTGPAVVAPGWACVGAGTSREALPTDATIECTTPTIARGAATVLTAGLSSDGSVRGLLPSFRATVQPIGGPDGSSVDVAVTVHASALEVAAAPAIVHAGTFAVGDQASLTFTVANSGNAAATSSSATVSLPTQVVAALDAGSTSGCAAATGGRTVTCDLGALAAGQDTKVQLGVRAVNAGSGDVAVTLSGGNGPAAGDSEPVVVASGGLMPRFSTVGLAGTWNVVEMGAPLLTCSPSAQCSGALTGKGPTLNNNDLTMVALLEKGIADAKVASSAQLHMPAGREVAFAGLYWAASGGSPTTQPVTARLAGPGRGFAAVTGALLAPTGGAAGAHEYQAFADVTAQVRTGGAGAWTFADPSNGVGSGAGAYAGWALVVVYADSSAGAGTVVVHDGAVTVNVGSSASLSVATTPGQTARVGVVAWEGDRGSSGDTLTLDGAPLVPVRWTGSGDAAGDATNAFDSTAVGSDYANSLGVDAKGFLGTVIAAPRAPAVAGSSVLTARSPHEAFVLGVVTVLTR